MNSLVPHLEILPPAQRALYAELHGTPEHFTLYGGTGLALHLGHRESVDFDFFSREPFEPDELLRTIPYLAGTKVKVLPERAEEKDYRDIAALLTVGMDLATMLAAANAIYGPSYNPLLSLKALTYFEDLPRLPETARKQLRAAALGVDLGALPVLKPVQSASAKDQHS